jgi:hypothetical protein
MNQSNVALGSVASGIKLQGLADVLRGMPAELAGQLVACMGQVAEQVECFFAGAADAVAHLRLRVRTGEDLA